MAIDTRGEAGAALLRKARLCARLAGLVAERNRLLAEAQRKHATEIQQLEGDVQALDGELRDWAEANRKEFGEGQTLKLDSGELKFRLGNRRLALLARWTWDKVLQAILLYGPATQWAEYIRKDPELDKAKLLRDTNDAAGQARLPAAALSKVGLRIDRAENFEAVCRPELLAPAGSQ
jgi:phage host-nuclease inhibitor protein Gam